MFQQGQVIRLRPRGSDGSTRWAYRDRVGGRGSQRVQRGGFKSEQAAIEALERSLERLRRERGLLEDRRCASLSRATSPSTTASRRRLKSSAGCSRRSARSAIAGSATFAQPRSRPGE